MDVEEGLIEIRQGPRNNVQILPLNMVNMLQLVKNKGCSEDEGSPNETLRLWGIRHLAIGENKGRANCTRS